MNGQINGQIDRDKDGRTGTQRGMQKNILKNELGRRQCVYKKRIYKEAEEVSVSSLLVS